MAQSKLRKEQQEILEGTDILSTGEAGGTKFLREDGDGTCSWQAPAGGGDALVANPLSQFAATTSLQLKNTISDETGSGALVFATSPTLVTPVLGTPTSGTATNLTGLPLTTGVTGTLPVENGGTGRTTSTTAYGLLAAGTTAAGVHQTLPAGATTAILVGGGASALPVWTTATGTGSPVRGTSPAFTTSITTGSTSFTALAGATTLLTLGGTGASASTFMPSTLDTTSSTTGAIRTSGGISAAKAGWIGTKLNVGTTLELGHATDTTLSRVSAGVLAVEGVNVVTTSSTDTLTNKTLTSPVINTPAMGADSIDAITEIATAIKTGTDTKLVTGTAGTAGNIATWDANGDIIDAGVAPATLTSSINFIIDGGGSAITTGIKGDVQIDFDCTIDSVTLLADQSGSIVVDIWNDTYANYPATDADSITASAVPTISTATKSTDATLTGWTTTISAGDILRFNVDSITTCERVTLVLKVTRT